MPHIASASMVYSILLDHKQKIAASGMGLEAKPHAKYGLVPTVKHTGQESRGQLITQHNVPCGN